jgi:membrane protein required for colicin V production
VGRCEGMVLDLIFGLILLVMLAIGAWRGAVVSGSGLFAMIAGYVGGILGAMKGAGWVAHALVVSPLVAPAIAGTIGFVVVWLIVSSIADVLIVWDRGRVELTGRGIFDRGFGAFFGLARGGLIVVLLAVLVSWLDAARDIGAVSGLSAMPDAENSTMAIASGNLVESAVATALSDSGPAGEVAARLTAHPGQSLESVQAILDDDRLNLMLEDRLFWTLIRNDSIDYAMNRSAIRSIVNDPEMRGRFADVGLVGEAAREDVDVFRDSFAAVLTEVGPKIQQLQQDPEVLALATDPEIMAMVEVGDTFALMNHPRIRKIVSRLASGL